MAKKFKIALDCMGFENDPIIAYNAATKYHQLNPDITFVLIGNEQLKDTLANKNMEGIEFVFAADYVKQDDKISIIRSGKDLSIVKGCELLNEDKVDALFSACNTAVFVSETFIRIGTLDNVNKFAFLTVMASSVEGKWAYMLDSGANKSCTGYDLYTFALMANIYVTQVTDLKHPRIGLLNVGTEAGKGFDEHKDAAKLLEQNKSLNYVGYVEPRNILNIGDADIYVSNGYTGNIILKSLEGAMKTFANFFKTEYHKWYNLGAYLSNRHILKKMKQRFDYKTRAGAFLLGLKKPVIKGHGSSDEEQITSCIRMMHEALENDVFHIINETISKEMKDDEH